MAAARKSALLLNPLTRFLHLGTPRGFLSALCQFHSSSERNHSNRTSIVRCGRKTYSRTYPVLLVQPDGSTISIQYKEPRRMLLMPVDLNTLPEEEKRARLRKRDQRKKTVRKEMEETGDDFDVDKYSKFWKKK